MKKVLILIAILILFSLLLISCEPTDWEYVLAAPGPVENYTIDHTALSQTITINFTYPSSSANQYQDDSDSIVVWLYFRPVNSDDEVFIIEYQCALDIPFSDVDRDLTSLSLSTGTDYDFIIYTIDTEYQRSAPVIETKTW